MKILILTIFLNTVVFSLRRKTNQFKISPKLTRALTMVPDYNSGAISTLPLAIVSGSWWDDDLPNILGINPIEAAIIFGVLYYIYGPAVLYDYAREAGKFVSTYAPIFTSVSKDIFYEFRDYFEEDREREMLRKQGVDVSNMPRRTTNLVERFKQTYEVSFFHLPMYILHLIYNKTIHSL